MKIVNFDVLVELSCVHGLLEDGNEVSVICVSFTLYPLSCIIFSRCLLGEGKIIIMVQLCCCSFRCMNLFDFEFELKKRMMFLHIS